MALSRNFTGTYNNPPITGEEFLAVLKALPGCVAATHQLEKGAEGTPHFQWMVSLGKPQRLPSITKKLKGCHVDVARNALAAWRYCQKEDTRIEGPWEHGVPPAAKNRKGDTAERNAIIMKDPLKAVEDGYLRIEKFRQTVQSIQLFQVMKKENKSNDILDNEWHYGPTGTGKSRLVRTKWPDAFIKSNDVWWDGYQGEETVIIEEMGPKQIGGHHMKIWADHYAFKAAVKGSQISIRPKRIIVTSNYSIEEVYPEPQDYEPLKRRFTTHIYKTLDA